MTVENSSASKLQAISAVTVAVIVTVGVIVSAVILANGDYGRKETCAQASSQTSKLMDENMDMDVTLQMNGNTWTQGLSYNHDSNTVLVETPAMNGSDAATIAVDYDRNLVFINIHTPGVCVASALGSEMHADMEDSMGMMLSRSDQDVIDIAKTRIVSQSYTQVGEIPAGYVTETNGPIIRGLCSGRDTVWTEPTAAQSKRRKRAIGPFNFMFCVWRVCFDIDLSLSLKQ